MTFSFFRNPYLFLSYDAGQLTDGVGAQLQRIWKIYWIAKALNLNYIHTPIDQIVWSPLDNWRGEKERNEFLEEFNKSFTLPSDSTDSFDVTKSCEVLTRRILFVNYVQSYLHKKTTHIKVLYSFDVKKKAIPSLTKLKSEINSENCYLIVIHIRNSLPITGVQQWRNLDIDYYLKLLRVITTDLNDQNIPYEVKILTDFPKEDLVVPIESIEKEHLWMYFLTEDQKSSSKFEIKGNDIKSLYFTEDPKVSVLHGGNPIELLEIMAAANCFIMSRSSFSAIGGMLNKNGVIIQPPDFQYITLKNWEPAKHYIKIEEKWRSMRYPRLNDFLLKVYFLQCLRLTVKIFRKMKFSLRRFT